MMSKTKRVQLIDYNLKRGRIGEITPEEDLQLALARRTIIHKAEQLAISMHDAMKEILATDPASIQVALTDQTSGKSYVVIPAECGVDGCFCVSLIVRDIRPN
jgi:hypothetical protein